MASFPLLKTGAVAQYPSDRVQQSLAQVYRFLDGSEQRLPMFKSTLKRWVIRMDRLDEGELANVENFFLSQTGRAGSFSFTDPWDGVEHTNCSFDDDTLTGEFRGVGQSAISVAIKENR